MTATIPGAACPHVTGRVACDGCWDTHLHSVATGGPWRGTDEAAVLVTRIDAALPLFLADLPDRGYGSSDLSAYREYCDDGWRPADVDEWLAAGAMDARTAAAHRVVLEAGYHAVAGRFPDRTT